MKVRIPRRNNMTFPVFNQQDNKWGNHELGVGQGYLIKRYGCALTCLCALANYYGRTIDPGQLNLELVAHNGFASNGTTNSDGTVNKTFLYWGTLAAVYGEIILEKNVAYPASPADMGMVDAYLQTGKPVVVGVSFLHNPKDTVPSHYVVLYQKNDDGTYLCMDPWFGDKTSFNTRYAVNGMSVANAILQVVAYSGPVPENKVEEAPIAAHPQQAVTPEDIARSQSDANYNLYLQEVELVKQKDDRIMELQQKVQELEDANRKLTVEIGNTKALNSTLASHLATLEASDSQAVQDGLKAEEQKKANEEIIQQTAEILHVKPDGWSILKGVDSLLSHINFLKKQAPKEPKEKDPILQLLGFKEGVN
jgi:hypothetical protein